MYIYIYIYNEHNSSTSTDMILRPPMYCDAPWNINGSDKLNLELLHRSRTGSTLVYVFGNAPPLYYIGEFRHLGLARGTNILMSCSSRLTVHSRREVKILLCRKWDG